MTGLAPLVVLTQPYVPAYRVPLFNAVDAILAGNGVRFLVAAGEPTGSQAARGDSSHAPWRQSLRERSIPVGRWRIARRVIELDAVPDVLVSELEALNTLAWEYAFRRRKLILWGHGKPYVNRSGKVSESIEWALARRACAVMTYAPSGRDYLLERGGIDADKVFSIGNSTDSATLRTALLGVDAGTQHDLRAHLGGGPTALFVGGLDESKRIGFLLESARAAIAINPDFRLIIVGRGDREKEVHQEALPGGPVVYLPQARGAKLAELAHVASAIWMPGRIGLVAVDAIAMNLPVFTTDFEFHAPEIEFLRGKELQIFPDIPEIFARRALEAMALPGPEMRDDFPTIQSVADSMAQVIIGAL
jgi:glycosyltransferase involved in cell wall biosynthesis